MIELQTARLKLRQWTPADRQPFAALNADPRVMEFFPTVLDRAGSDAIADYLASFLVQHGWGFWAVETRRGKEFVGFVGLHIPATPLPFMPCVEIGWRLAYRHWGKGYAAEAGLAALQVGFGILGLDEIVSLAAAGNHRSRAVMERLGMQESGTFMHPALPPESPLREHCLYRLSRPQCAGRDPF